MNQRFEPFFPTEFLMEYLSNGPAFAENRFLTYVSYRFLAAIQKDNPDFAVSLSKRLPYAFTRSDFSKIEAFLSEDFYFSTGFAADSMEPYLLLVAITIVNDETCAGQRIFESVLAEERPAVCATDFDEPDLNLRALLQTEADFFAALYQIFTKHRISMEELFPKFAELYWEDLHFTCEDFVLYDFMNEYFGLKNCLSNEAFLELIDTLANATLGYQNTSIEQLLSGEISSSLRGTASKFSAMKRYGFVKLPEITDFDAAGKMLFHFFEYAAAYELRNHLFDYHLDEDKLITLENWKEKLHWHYVQYSSVTELALSSFYAACLSKTLLESQFAANLLAL